MEKQSQGGKMETGNGRADTLKLLALDARTFGRIRISDIKSTASGDPLGVVRL